MKVYKELYLIRKAETDWEKDNFLKSVGETLAQICKDKMKAEIHYSSFACQEIIYNSALILAYTEE